MVRRGGPGTNRRQSLVTVETRLNLTVFPASPQASMASRTWILDRQASIDGNESVKSGCTLDCIRKKRMTASWMVNRKSDRTPMIPFWTGRFDRRHTVPRMGQHRARRIRGNTERRTYSIDSTPLETGKRIQLMEMMLARLLCTEKSHAIGLTGSSARPWLSDEKQEAV